MANLRQTEAQTNVQTLATWPPRKETRVYSTMLDGNTINDHETGRALGSQRWADEAMNMERIRNLFDSLKIYTNLPKIFFERFLKTQYSSQPINFPKMQNNKNVSVLSCMKQHDAFMKGTLAIKNWQALGWSSQHDYEHWLNSSMLTAFSGTLHYCSAVRRFDYSGKKDGKDIFTELSPEKSLKITNILSVAGFEYRNIKYSAGLNVPFQCFDQTLSQIEAHSQTIMKSILQAAQDTSTPNIVIVPYGMGVFLPADKKEQQQARIAMYAGMKKALQAYEGSKITIHCCGFPGFFEALNQGENPRIHYENKAGFDAYAVTNALQDDEQTSLMVNAGDNDWTAGLNSEKIPGQCFFGHTLYHQTADEYLALMTSFSFFSIQRAILEFKDNFSSVITSTYQSTEVHFSENAESSIEKSSIKQKTRRFRYAAPLILGGIIGVLVGAVAAALLSSLALVGIALVAICSGLAASVLSVGIAYRFFGINTNKNPDSMQKEDPSKDPLKSVDLDSSSPAIVQGKSKVAQGLSNTGEPFVRDDASKKPENK